MFKKNYISIKIFVCFCFIVCKTSIWKTHKDPFQDLMYVRYPDPTLGKTSKMKKWPLIWQGIKYLSFWQETFWTSCAMRQILKFQIEGWFLEVVPTISLSERMHHYHCKPSQNSRHLHGGLWSFVYMQILP